LSVLDQSPIPAGSTAADALRNTVDLARLAESLGYHRYWLAEHHNSSALAGSSPEILIGQVASATSTIRVGSGGVMLSHYSALKVAENFSLLQTLFPDRIDLGVGRAPGSDQLTARALQRDHVLPGPDEFGRQLAELVGFLNGGFEPTHAFSRIHVGAGDSGPPELWMLGSTGYSAAYAAYLGLPFCFADFITPESGPETTAAYRKSFIDAHPDQTPATAVGVAVICAEDNEAADRLASSLRWWRLRLGRGDPGPIPSVQDSLAHEYSLGEREGMLRSGRRLVMGGPQEVRTQLEELAADYGADEILAVTIVHDHGARRRSYELLAQAFDLPGPTPTG
jgi:luciferase family oxidoreductase group 1